MRSAISAFYGIFLDSKFIIRVQNPKNEHEAGGQIKSEIMIRICSVRGGVALPPPVQGLDLFRECQVSTIALILWGQKRKRIHTV